METTTKDIIKRNNRILNFFKERNLNIRLVGDLSKPALIINDDICLSCYVSGFYLNLTDGPFNSKLISSIKLSHIISDEYNQTIDDWIDNAKHRVIHTIYFVHNNIKMYLCGFNTETLIIDDKKIIVRIPVFSHKLPNIYFNLDSAKNIIKEINQENLSLLISNYYE